MTLILTGSSRTPRDPARDEAVVRKKKVEYTDINVINNSE